MSLSAGADLSLGPRHIACVPDGNGRWAQARGLERTDGHAAGEQATCNFVFGAADLGVEWVTIYAFSTENWERPVSEVEFIMALIEQLLVLRINEFHARDIRVRFIGRRDATMPASLLRAMDQAIAQTAANGGMTFTIALNYGGRTELVDAVKRLIEDGVRSDQITGGLIRSYLYDAEMPDPDLVIRTSGEYRISNFLLWELAYAELLFSPVLWPDFTREHLVAAILEYQHRVRRFGGLDPRRGNGQRPLDRTRQ